MTSGIPGSGGPGGAGKPGGPGSPGSIDDAGDAEAAVESGAPLEVHAARTAAAGGAASGTHAIGDTSGASGPSGIDRIAADLDAGRISGREALDRLMDEAVPDEAELGPEERAELREAMRELLANDPHLQSLAARIGAGTAKGDD